MSVRHRSTPILNKRRGGSQPRFWLALVLVWPLVTCSRMEAQQPQRAVSQWQQLQVQYARWQGAARWSDCTGALHQAERMVATAPAWGGVYLLRAYSEACLNHWSAALADDARAGGSGLSMAGQVEADLLRFASPDAEQQAAGLSQLRELIESPPQKSAVSLAFAALAVRESRNEIFAWVKQAGLPPSMQETAVSSLLTRAVSPGLLSLNSYVSLLQRTRVMPHRKEVLSILDSATTSFGEDPKFDVWRVRWLEAQHQYEAANAWASAAMKRHPNNSGLKRELVRLASMKAVRLIDTGDPDGALRQLGEFRTGEPQAISILRARALAEKKQFPAALADLTRASVTAAPAPTPLSRMSPVELAVARKALALDPFSYYLRIRPDKLVIGQDLLYWQALIAYQAGDWAAAAGAAQFSPLNEQGIGMIGDYILARSLEKEHETALAHQSWAKLDKLAQYTVMERYAAAGMRRTGAPSKHRLHDSYSWQGQITEVICRNRRPIGLYVANGLLDMPIRLAAGTRFPLKRCGLLGKRPSAFVQLRPDESLMPRWIAWGTRVTISSRPSRLLFVTKSR